MLIWLEELSVMRYLRRNCEVLCQVDVEGNISSVILNALFCRQSGEAT